MSVRLAALSHPIRAIFLGVWASAASGHATAVAPTRAMNSRRLTAPSLSMITRHEDAQAITAPQWRAWREVFEGLSEFLHTQGREETKTDPTSRASRKSLVTARPDVRVGRRACSSDHFRHSDAQGFGEG